MAQSNIRVLIFPWLAHGHIFPFFELAKKLSKRNFNVYFCSTAINLSQIKENLADISMELVELHLPDLPDLPRHYHTTKGLPPNLAPTLFHAFEMAKPSFLNIINSLSPDLLIYDGFQTWAPELASVRSIPSVFFVTSGAATMSFFYHLHKYGFNRNVSFPFPAIHHRDYEIRKFAGSNFREAAEMNPFKCFELSSNLVLIKTCEGIEGKYLNYLSSLSGKNMVPVGPLVHDNDDQSLDIIDWLNKKDQSSVLFVSFGSEYFLSKEEREEIAHGLELSNVHFIWVLRFSMGDTITIEQAFPEGFLERVINRGMVVQGWAPQARILEHSSTGGFLSHCGWSSLMESLYYGVPVAAMPMHNDQPTNARLMVEIGVGMEVVRDENGQLKREEIAKAIKEVVLEKTGEEIRAKARELSDELKKKGDQEVDEAIEKLRHICIQNLQQH